MPRSYNIPVTLANKLAKKENHSLRNALRLFFFLKTSDGMQSAFYLKQVRPELLNHFSYRLIKKYLDILIAEGWMGKDRHGKYFLRGRDLMFKKCSSTSRLSCAIVNNEHTTSQTNWMAFLNAVVVCSIQRNIRRTTDEALVKVASTLESRGSADAKFLNLAPSPVSTENIVQTVGVSRATASRMRQRAARAGLIINKQVYEDTGMSAGSATELLMIRSAIVESRPSVRTQRLQAMSRIAPGDGKVINPDALVLRRDGIVIMQKPNMIANKGINFRRLSR